MLRFTSWIIIFAVLSGITIADDPCKVTDGSRGGTLDISSLSSGDGKAKFPDLLPTQGGANWKYSFNPCQPFNEGSNCIGVAVCQVEANGPDTHILGKQDSARWDTKPGTSDNPTLSYSYSGDTGQKNVQIELICNGDFPGSLEALGEGDPGSYKFKLSSKCACWNGCSGPAPTTTGSPGPSPTPAPPGGGSGFPIGGFFIIILVALAVVYFTVFALINRFGRHQSGLDLIAHRTFWVAVPVYAKDGVVFLFRRVTGKGGHTSI